MTELDSALDIILQSEPEKEKARERNAADSTEALRRELDVEPSRHQKTGLAALSHITQQRRAERILAEQDASVRAGPDAVKARLENTRATGDPSGQTSPGLGQADRTRRMNSLLGDERLLDFYELNPEANLWAADDDSYMSLAWETVRDFPKEVGEAVESSLFGFQQGRVQKDLGRVQFDIMEARTSGFGAENLPQLQAKEKRLKSLLSTFPNPDEQDTFDKYIGSTGQFAGQMLQDFTNAGAATLKVEAVAIPAVTAVGAVVAGPVGGAAGASVSTAAAPFIFTAMLAREIWVGEAGLMSGELIEAGFDPESGDVAFASNVYGALSTLVEMGSLKMLGKAGSDVKEAALVNTRKLLGKHAQSYFADTTRKRLAGQAMLSLSKAALAEGGEEFVQTSILSALAHSLADGDGDLVEVINGTVERLPEAIEAAKLAAGGLLLGGGMVRVGTAYHVNKAAKQAKKEKAFFAAYEELIQTSEMIRRDPQLAGEFLDFTLNQDTDHSTIYVETSALVEALAAQGLTLEEAEAHLPGIQERVDRAHETGGRVALPAKEFGAQVAGTPLFQDIREHISTTATGLTGAERTEEFARSERVAQGLERDKATERLEVEDSADRVTEKILAQLKASGRFSDAQAKLQAEPVRARVVGYAQMLSQAAGKTVTPEEAFALAPLTVLSQEESASAEARAQAVEDQFILDQPFVIDAALRLADGRTFTGNNHGAAFEAAEAAGVTDEDGDFEEGFMILKEIEDLAEDEETPEPYFADRYETNELVGSDESVRIGENQGSESKYLGVTEDQRTSTFDAIDRREARKSRIAGSGQVLDQSPTGPQKGRVSTRVPTVKKPQEDVFSDERLSVSVVGLSEAFKAKQLAIISNYVNMTGETIEEFQEHVTSNLLWLHDSMDPDIRQRAKMWYDGANLIAHSWSGRYDISANQVAGVLAAMSPQKDWFMNVTLAERVLEAWTTDDVLTDEMVDAAVERKARSLATAPKARRKSEVERTRLVLEFNAEIRPLVGLNIHDVEGQIPKAKWARAWSQGVHAPNYRIVTPEGAFAEFATTGDGKPQSVAWGSYSEIGSAIAVLLDPSAQSFSTALGGQHKVRSFHNNIIEPEGSEDVTIDTHAVAAGLLQPLSGKSTEVSHNFGGKGSSTDGPTGTRGTYAIFADAYRALASQVGILAREGQSITWEAVRSMYPAASRRDKKLIAATREVWQRHRDGDLSIEDAREELYDLAGGIGKPDWADADPNGVEEAGDSSFLEGVARDIDGARASAERSRSARRGGVGDRTDAANAESVTTGTGDQLDAGPNSRSQRIGESEGPDRGIGLLDDAGNPIDLEELYRAHKNTPEAQRSIYRHLGLAISEGENTGDSLKIYPLDQVFGDTIEEVDAQLNEWLSRVGWEYRKFGPKSGPNGKALYPNFQDGTVPSYEDGVAWIFDPAEEDGSFRDHAYTLAWRVTHEIAHGIVNEKLTRKYGGRGRRAGAMGRVIRGPFHKNDTMISLADAMRAVEWEYETFIEQRRILEEEFGVVITDGQFNRENSINLADAVYRAVTGQFGNPGEIGIHPSNLDAAEMLDKALDLLRDIAFANDVSMDEKLEVADTRRFPVDSDGAAAGKAVLDQNNEAGQSSAAVQAFERLIDALDQPFHGGPNDHDGFLLKYLGTGARSQRFGYGHYFTSLREIAEDYKRATAQTDSIRPKQLSTPEDMPDSLRTTVLRMANRMFRAADFEAAPPSDLLIENSIETLRSLISDASTAAENQDIQSEIAYLEALSPDDISVAEPEEGQVFEVSIPDDSELMDWDVPLDEQNPRAIEVLRELFDTYGSVEVFDEMLEDGESLGGFITDSEISAASPQSISEALAAVGVKGHKYAAGQIHGGGRGATNYVIYEDEAVSIIKKFYQEDEDASAGPRGQIALKDNAAFLRLTEASDLTTFGHELAHWFLHQMVVAQSLGLSSSQMDSDLQTVVDWTGARDVDSLTLPFEDGRFQPGTTVVDKPHEIFARGWEAYQATGQAPTAELRNIFRGFRKWVHSVYGGIRATLQRVGADLTPEIREVYDRLFDAELAVDEVSGNFDSPLFESAAAAGLEEGSAAWRSYLKRFSDARERALDAVAKIRVAEIAKRKLEEARLERGRIRTEVEKEHQEDPTWNVIRWIKRDMPPYDAPGAPEAGTGLSPSAIREIYGEAGPRVIEILNDTKAYGRGRKLVNKASAKAADFYEIYDTVPDGIDPNDIAELFGFPSGRALVDSILSSNTIEQDINTRVNQEVSQSAYYQDDATLEEAHATVANEDREQLLKLELRFLREALRDGAEAQARKNADGRETLSATEARQGVDDAQAELREAARTGDEDVTAPAQAAVVGAEATSRVSAEGRRADRAAGRRAGALEIELDTGRIKRRAAELVGDLPTGRISAERRSWNGTSVREGKKARKALAERRYADALGHVERQLLAHFASEEVTRIEREVQKGQQYASKFRKAKELAKLQAPGFDGTRVVLGLMERFDMRKTKQSDPDKQPTKMERKMRSAMERQARTDAFEALLDFKEKADANAMPFDYAPFLNTLDTEIRHWTELSVSEFLGLIDTIRNVEAVTKSKVADIRTGIAIDQAEAAEQVGARIREHAPRVTERMLKQRGIGKDTVRAAARRLDAGLLKFEDMFDFMGGDNINNPVRTFFWEPVQQGTEKLRLYLDAWADPLDEAIKSLDWDRLSKPVQIQGFNREVYGYEILMMGLNAGTESNWFKLVEGYRRNERYGWDESAFDDALAWIKDDEWDTIQNIWDLLNTQKIAVDGQEISLKDLLFEHEFEQTGRRPSAVDNREFTTRSGKKMRGGYIPLVYDPTLDKRAKKIAEDIETKGMFGYSHTRAETSQGHLKGRVEGFVAPILLDPSVLSTHMERVLHDVALREAVVNTHKIMNSKVVKDAVEDVWGREYHEAMNEWLKKVARVKTPTLERSLQEAGSISRWMRQGTTMVGLGFRMATGILQLSGVLPVFGEVGYRATTASLARFAASPIDTMTQALEMSGELRARARTRDRDLMEAIDGLRGKPKATQFAQTHAFMFITAGDRVVSTIAWDAQYNQSMRDHGNEAQAVREADRAIRRTQGGGDVKDNSILKNTDNELLRWATLFGSFASNLYARQRRIARVARGDQALSDNEDGTALQKRNLPHAISLWAATIFAPAVLEALVREGGPPEDEEDIPMWAFGHVASFHVMPVPYASEGIQALLFPEKQAFSGRSPSARFFKPVYGVAGGLQDFVVGDDVDGEKMLRDTMTLVGLGLHLPVGQLDIWVDNFWEDQRLVGPESPRDFIWRKPRD